MEKTEFRAALHGAMADMLRDKVGLGDVAEVTEFEQDERSFGYCETCYSTEVFVRITYRTTGGYTETYDYYGDLAGLIRALTD